MNEKTKFLRTMKLEMDISFPFPLLVAIPLFFIVYASYSVAGWTGLWGPNISLPFYEENVDAGEYLVMSIIEMAGSLSVIPFLSSLYVVMLLVPLLVAFNFAQGFNSGQIRILLSYPIGRARLIVVKASSIAMLLSASVTVGCVASLLFFYPFLVNAYLLFVLSFTFCINTLLITATCMLISVISRNGPVTLFTGVGIWVVFFMVFMTPQTSPIVRYLLYPFLLAVSHIRPGYPMGFLDTITLIDVLSSSVIALMLAIALLFLSRLLFSKMEI